jgi:hypothetical protein
MPENPKWVTEVPAGSTDLQIQTVVMVPSTTHRNRPIAKSSMDNRIRDTKKVLSQLFGGYTSVRGQGGYYSKETGKLISEAVVEVSAFAEKERFRKYKARWLAWVQHQAKAWGQESMGIIIENDMFYVPASR